MVEGGGTTAPGDPSDVRKLLQQRRAAHRHALRQEAERLAAEAAALGVQRVILFGSIVRDEDGLMSDLDLLIVWDTPLNFLERTVELYRRLQPRIATDLLVYTPAEMERMAHTPLVRRALQEGRVLYEA
ncbi:MAG: nucleotidyltransferase domain-containing protein [Roseiflexaceae bacterium]|nr:nucleotidyltransferase domain-containing protein [Roseiflexaceae bacterium]